MKKPLDYSAIHRGPHDVPDDMPEMLIGYALGIMFAISGIIWLAAFILSKVR